MIRLVVGLGNPGSKYSGTRHNIGEWVVRELECLKGSSWQSKFKGEFSSTVIDGEKRYFVIPKTYMNLSGECVSPMANFFKISVDEILVVHDEIDFPFGQMTLKVGGGLAGHNGLKSLKQHIGSQDFNRLRLGVDRPAKGEVANWVLSDFSVQEKSQLEEFREKSEKAILLALKDGPVKAANKVNTKNF